MTGGAAPLAPHNGPRARLARALGGAALALCLASGIGAPAAAQPAAAPAQALDAPALALRDAVRAARQGPDAPPTPQAETLAALQEKTGLTEGQLHAALLALGSAQVPPDRLAARLAEIAASFKTLEAAMAPQQDDDASTAALKALARTAIAEGRFGHMIDAIAAIEGSSGATGSAQSLALRGEVALAGLRYRDAAALFAQAAEKRPQGGAQADDLRKQYEALFRQADDLGETAAFGEAVAVARRGLDLVSRSDNPLAWAAWQMRLGAAMERLGETEKGPGGLNEAVAAFRAALEAAPRADDPLQWATAQAGIGDAMLASAMRDKGTANLANAIAAYRAALEVLTRENAPQLWAATQYNLGNALETQGERTAGATELYAAVAAYDAAVEERSRARAPLRWARATGNQGVALMLIAQRIHDAGSAAQALEQIGAAAAAAREAGDEKTAASYESIAPSIRRLIEALSVR